MQTVLDDALTLFFQSNVNLLKLFATLPGLNKISHVTIETHHELL